VQRLFGTYIPPKKIPKPKKYVTLRFKITDLIPSKKNDYYSENNIRFVVKQALSKYGVSMKAFGYIVQNCKSWIRGSKKYLQWLESIDAEIMPQVEFWRTKYGITYPLEFVSIKTYYHFSDMTARDLISKNESVFDMLVSKSIIADDNYGVLYKYSSSGECAKDEVVTHLCTIDITLLIF
jgi:hypothetical protein